MNQNTPVPGEIQPFKAYGTGIACKEGMDVLYRAVLGNIEKGTDAEKKASFFVYVWSEKEDGTVTLISIENPPKNAPVFFVRDGRLILTGVLNGVVVEREVPGFVAPPAPLTAGGVMTVLIQQLAKPDTNIAKAIGAAALATVRAALGK